MPESDHIERQMERLRPDQLRNLRSQVALAYLPLGILEWHGPQNPLGLDGVKAHALCMRAAARSGGVVFPTLYYGPPPAANYLEVDSYDPAFPQAYGVPQEHYTTDMFRFGSRVDQWHLFDRVLDQALRQIARFGFKAIFVLAGHYPLNNQRAITMSFQRDVQIPVWLGHEGELNDSPGGDHAAQWETSVMWALEPDTVNPDAFPEHGQPNPPGVFGKPVADVTPELAQKNLEQCLEGIARKANELLVEAADLAGR